MSVSRITPEAHNRQNARAKISVPFYFSERQSPARYASVDCKSSPFPQQEIHHTEDLSTVFRSGRAADFKPHNTAVNRVRRREVKARYPRFFR